MKALKKRVDTLEQTGKRKEVVLLSHKRVTAGIDTRGIITKMRKP